MHLQWMYKGQQQGKVIWHESQVTLSCSVVGREGAQVRQMREGTCSRSWQLARSPSATLLQWYAGRKAFGTGLFRSWDTFRSYWHGFVYSVYDKCMNGAHGSSLHVRACARCNNRLFVSELVWSCLQVLGGGCQSHAGGSKCSSLSTSLPHLVRLQGSCSSRMGVISCNAGLMHAAQV